MVDNCSSAESTILAGIRKTGQVRRLVLPTSNKESMNKHIEHGDPEERNRWGDKPQQDPYLDVFSTLFPERKEDIEHNTNQEEEKAGFW